MSVYKYAIVISLRSVTHSTTTTRKDNRRPFMLRVTCCKKTYIIDDFYGRVNGIPHAKSDNSSPSVDYTMTASIELIKRVKQKK